MAKDPAFLFYDGDAARDVSHLNRLERGCYFDILQAQRKFGRMSVDLIKKVLGKDFNECWEQVKICLTYEEDMFFIAWLEDSTNKRKAYSESRSKNRNSSKSTTSTSTYVPHMENENENIISNKINTNNNTLVTDMIKIFKERNPSYPIDAEAHYPQVLQIAYRIAKMKGWEQKEVLNGRMRDTLKSWTTIVDFILTDDWLTTRGLIDLNSNKEWDRLILKMTKSTQDRLINQKKEFIGSPIKKEEEVDFDKYKRK